MTVFNCHYVLFLVWLRNITYFLSQSTKCLTLIIVCLIDVVVAVRPGQVVVSFFLIQPWDKVSNVTYVGAQD